MSDNKWYAENQATQTIRELGITDISIIYNLSDKEYCENYYNHFQKYYKKRGGQILQTTTYSSGQDQDWMNIAKQLDRVGSQGILMIGNATEVAMICQQLKKINSRSLLICDEGSMTDSFLQYGGKNVEGVYFNAASYDKYNTNSEHIEFVKNFTNRFGFDPNGGSVNVYDIITVLKDALKDKDDLSPEGIKKAIIDKGKFSGLQGDIIIDEYGDAIKKPFVFVVENGKFQRID